MSFRDKRRKFGQNYLIDPAILYEMEESINPQAHDRFIEIGPGMGALTKILNKESIHITAIDIDRDWLRLVEIDQDWSIFAQHGRVCLKWVGIV